MMAGDKGSRRVTVPAKNTAPLPENLRHELHSLLLDQQMIKQLQSTLLDTTTSVGWQTSVEERVLQLLRDGNVRNLRELERVVVGEALGRDLLENDNEEESKDKRRDSNAYNGEKGDIKMPHPAIKAGKKVVRDALDRSVDVSEEKIEEQEWSDWR